MDSSASPKDEISFLRVCHHISSGLYLLRFCSPVVVAVSPGGCTLSMLQSWLLVLGFHNQHKRNHQTGITTFCDLSSNCGGMAPVFLNHRLCTWMRAARMFLFCGTSAPFRPCGRPAGGRKWFTLQSYDSVYSSMWLPTFRRDKRVPSSQCFQLQYLMCCSCHCYSFLKCV